MVLLRLPRKRSGEIQWPTYTEEDVKRAALARKKGALLEAGRELTRSRQHPASGASWQVLWFLSIFLHHLFVQVSRRKESSLMY